MAGRFVLVAPSKHKIVNKRIRDRKILVGKAVILSVTKSSRKEIFEPYGAISP